MDNVKHGNQHWSRKLRLLEFLQASRAALRRGEVVWARYMLETYRYNYAKAPASTRRRWKCGR